MSSKSRYIRAGPFIHLPMFDVSFSDVEIPFGSTGMVRATHIFCYCHVSR